MKSKADAFEGLGILLLQTAVLAHSLSFLLQLSCTMSEVKSKAFFPLVLCCIRNEVERGVRSVPSRPFHH